MRAVHRLGAVRHSTFTSQRRGAEPATGNESLILEEVRASSSPDLVCIFVKR